jgi:hypothetical protein
LKDVLDSVVSLTTTALGLQIKTTKLALLNSRGTCIVASMLPMESAAFCSAPLPEQRNMELRSNAPLSMQPKDNLMNSRNHLVALTLLALCTTGTAKDTNSAKDDDIQSRSTPELKIQGIALPASWGEEPEKHGDTHTDAEWQSPTHHTVFGAVYIDAPPMVPGKSIEKDVKKNYVKRQPDGHITSEWTDSAGRNWFQVDASGTHTKAFVIAHGHRAWFVYYRYDNSGPSPRHEVDVADHAINEVQPTE